MRSYFGLKPSSYHNKRAEPDEKEAKKQLFKQFKLPENFYQRILELEQIIERQKENVDQPVLQQLMALYSQAIEYYGFIDDVDRCADLNMRMQGILVRPYILDSLSRINEEKQKSKKTEAKRIVLKSTPKQLSGNPDAQDANQAQNEQEDGEATTEDEAEPDSETTESENEDDKNQDKPDQQEEQKQEEEEQKPEAETQPDQEPEGEKKQATAPSAPVPVAKVEEKQRKTRAQRRQEPVKKTHIKRTVGAIEENHIIAIELIKTGLSSQTENVQDRLRKRKLELFKRQKLREANGGNLNQTQGEMYSSPNLSQIVDANNYNASLQVSQTPEDDSMMDQQNILNNLEDDLDPDDNLDEEEDAEENEEHLYEFERKQEECLEEFLEMAYTKKHEVLEEFKAFSKKNKLKKDIEKDRVKQIGKEIDAQRKKGTKELKAKFSEVLEDDELTLLGKLNAIQDPEIKDELKKIMDEALMYDTDFKVEEQPE